MLGAAELIIIALAFLLLFGPDKIPKIAKDFGRAWGELRKFQDELAVEVNAGKEALDIGLDGGKARMTAPTREPLTTGSSFKLKQMARKLGIDVTDKKDAQIIDAINIQMARLSMKEDGRALFKGLQEENREHLKRRANEKAKKLEKSEAAKKAGEKKETEKPGKAEKPVKSQTRKPASSKKTPEKTGKSQKRTTPVKKETAKNKPKTAVKTRTGRPTTAAKEAAKED